MSNGSRNQAKASGRMERPKDAKDRVAEIAYALFGTAGTWRTGSRPNG